MAVRELVVLLLLFVSCSLAQYKHRGSVEVKNYKLSTIDQFCHESIQNNSVYILFRGTHRLNTTCEKIYIANVTLDGSGAVVECSSTKENGFRFQHVSNLKILNIKLDGCGSSWRFVLPKYYGSFPDTILSALSLLNGQDLLLSKVSVLNGRSAGIYISNVAGNVTVDSCEVFNASSSTLDSLSGNVIVYDDNLANTTTLRIVHSRFISSGYTSIDGKCKLQYLSCGLALYLGSTEVSIDIFNTNFSQNIGCSGGNMAIVFFKFSSVVLFRVQFEEGSAHYNGGGMYVIFENSFLDKYSKPDYSYSPKALSITNSTFFNNFAQHSGGGMFVQWKQSTRLNGSFEVEIIDSKFDGNSLGLQGRGGLALQYEVYMSTSDKPNTVPRFHVAPTISNSTFSNHIPNITSGQLQEESSVILASTVPYLGINGVTIVSNNCSAILAIESTLVFSNSTRISHNSALSGGGLRLCSSSTIYLTPHTDLIITDNSARETGGGIQVDSKYLVSIPMCFYQYDQNLTMNYSLLKTVNFAVTNNTAQKAGENIYGGSIDYCYFLDIGTSNSSRYKLHNPKNTRDHLSSVSSDPQHVCFSSSQKLYVPNTSIVQLILERGLLYLFVLLDSSLALCLEQW